MTSHDLRPNRLAHVVNHEHDFYGDFAALGCRPVNAVRQSAC
jgi:hypothetical protein